jgi:hypothetical protein
VPKYVHVNGVRFSSKLEVDAPKRRFGLPCLDKSTCQIDRCKEVDRIEYALEFDFRGQTHRRGTIIRQPCDKDCEKRVNLEPVSVAVCAKAQCEFLTESGWCKKYVEEAKSHRSKPPAFQFAKGLRTPSSESRARKSHFTHRLSPCAS